MFEEKYGGKSQILEEVTGTSTDYLSKREKVVIGCEDGTISVLDCGIKFNSSFNAHSSSISFLQHLKVPLFSSSFLVFERVGRGYCGGGCCRRGSDGPRELRQRLLSESRHFRCQILDEGAVRGLGFGGWRAETRRKIWTKREVNGSMWMSLVGTSSEKEGLGVEKDSSGQVETPNKSESG